MGSPIAEGALFVGTALLLVLPVALAFGFVMAVLP